jgi:CRP-like cAMP-binding protein
VVADGDRVADLRRVDVLAALPEEALRSLAGRADVLAFVAGEEIVRQGEAGAELYILRRGEVSVHQLRGGELVELARMGPGAFFGEMSLLTGAARSATVRAESDSELLVLDPVALTPLLQAHPDMARRIGEVLVNRQVAQRNPEPELLIEEETARAEPLVERIRSFLRL